MSKDIKENKKVTSVNSDKLALLNSSISSKYSQDFVFNGPKLKELREILDLTQTDFGSNVGVTKETIANLERGTIQRPKTETINSIINFFKTLGVEISYTTLMITKEELDEIKSKLPKKKLSKKKMAKVLENGGKTVDSIFVK